MINRRDFLISAGVGIIAANRVVHGRVDDKFVQLQRPIGDPNVGFGFDSVLGQIKSEVFTPTFRNPSFPPYDDRDVFNYEIAKSQSDFNRITSLSGKGSGSYGLAKAKASASVKTFFKANSYSCYLIGYFRKSADPYDATRPKVDPRVLSFIRTNRNKPLLLERTLGDVVITGFNLAAEVLVVAQFQASSEEKKKEIAAQLEASYGTGKGSVKFAESVRKATSSERTTISVTGHIPDGIDTLTSEDAIIALLNKFNSDYKGKQRITSYRTRGYNTFIELLNYPFVSGTNIRLRNNFASKLNSLYQDHLDWSADIDYVLNNTNQFEAGVVTTARADKETCKGELTKLEALEESSLEAWERNENWKSSYNSKLLSKFRQNFDIYKQKETPVIVKPKPRQRPRKVRTDPSTAGDRGGRQGG